MKSPSRSLSGTVHECLVRAAVAIAVTISLLLPGCRRTAPITTTETAESDAATGCRNLLQNAMGEVKPAKLSVLSQRSMAAMQLNDWLDKCADDNVPEDWTAACSQALQGDDLRIAAAVRFSETDADYIRTSLLNRRYTAAIENLARNETGRVVELFYSVVRDVALQDDEDPLRVTPFEVLLLGEGTARDRAWLFGSMLRQMRIDSVILAPQAEDQSGWLVGVVVNKDVLLFDMTLGVPVFQGGTDAVPVTPVSLAALDGDDEILGGLSVDGADYPLTDADMKNPRVFVIGEPATWSYRCQLLQDELTGAQSVVLCDPLHDLDGTPGLISRVASAGEGLWAADTVAVWPYPSESVAAYEHRDETTGKRVRKALEPFGALMTRSVNHVEGEAILRFGEPSYRQFAARVGQLSSDPDVGATQLYQGIRLGKLDKEQFIPPQQGQTGPGTTVAVPENIYQLHERAAEDAMFWIAAEHYRQEKFAAAVDGFTSYLRSFPEGIWSVHAHYLAALAHARGANTQEALAMIDGAITDSNPQAAGCRLLRRHWQGLTPGSDGAADGDGAAEPGGAKEPDDAGEADAKEADAKEADTKEADTKEADAKEADAKEADGAKEADAKDADAKDADAKDADAKEADGGTEADDATDADKATGDAAGDADAGQQD